MLFFALVIDRYTTQFKHKLLSSNVKFEEFAFEAFNIQYNHNKIYRHYCDLIGTNFSSVNALEKIPFMPIIFFKQHKISVFPNRQEELIYTSSGTSGATTSKHYVYDNSFYLNNTFRLFEDTYGTIQDSIFLFLLPSYLERQGSSLVTMAQHFIEQSNNDLSGFFLDDYQSLKNTLLKALKTEKKIYLFGVSFGLLNFMESNPNIDLKNRITILETGGMKGQRKELTRTELHDTLKNYFKVEQIHSEYGMTELLSQSYSTGNGFFKFNPTFRALVRELKDPLTVHQSGKGALNIIDLANIDSCCFLATEDQGNIINDEFEVLGRLDHSDIRGCNLMISDL